MGFHPYHLFFLRAGIMFPCAMVTAPLDLSGQETDVKGKQRGDKTRVRPGSFAIYPDGLSLPGCRQPNYATYWGRKRLILL